MKYRTKLLNNLFFFIIVLLIFGNANQQEYYSHSVIKNLLQTNPSSLLVIDKETLYAQSQIKEFYQYGFYYPAWSDFTMQPNKLQELIDIIKKSHEDGFNPEDYHLEKIRELQKNILNINYSTSNKPFELAMLDILLSDAFLTLMLHNYAGKIRSKSQNRDFKKFFKELHLIDFLNKSIQKNEIQQAINSLQPPYQEYKNLKKIFNQYQKKTTHYTDSSLMKVNLSKIAINMERWRWLPKTTDSVFIIVNIPAFRLWVYKNDTVMIEIKTIVGKQTNPTPSFNSRIIYIVLRPQWNIPTPIMRKEILPEVFKNISYLAKNNIHITSVWKDREYEIAPSSIHWDSLSIKRFPYKLIQSPGSTNPLGEIKFMFPNQYNVYLHDTPSRKLFDYEIRSLSHGCIRIDKAKELGAFLLQNDTLILSKNYEDFFNENEIKKLDSPIPIYINYWTAWSKNSSIVFFKDIYKKDAYLEKVMNQKPYLY